MPKNYNPDIELSEADQMKLIQQVSVEAIDSINYLNPIWDDWDVLYNVFLNRKNTREGVNRRRVKYQDFSILNILTSLQTKLSQYQNNVRFSRGLGQSKESVDIMNSIVEHDYRVNNKAQLDARRTQNALMYGASDLLIHGIKDNAINMEVVNQRAFYYSKNSISGQGDTVRGEGKYQWAGFLRETTLNKLKKSDYYKMQNVEEEYYPGRASLKDMAKNAKMLPSATGFSELQDGYNATKPYGNSYFISANQGTKFSPNFPVYLLNHFTNFQGKLVSVTLTGMQGAIVRYEELPIQTMLPFVTRQIYSLPSSRNLISIPYLLYDKQMVKNRLINASVVNEIKKLSNIFLYNSGAVDPKRIRQEGEQFIPATGNLNDIVRELPRSSATATTDYILNTMTASQDTASQSSSTSRGQAPQNPYQTATTTAIADRAQEDETLARLNLFIEDDKVIPRLIMENYFSLSGGEFKKKVLRTSGAESDNVLEVSSAQLKEISEETLGEVVVENKLLKDRERAQIAQLAPQILQQVSLLVAQGADLTYAVKWALKKFGLEDKEIENMLPLNTQSEIAGIENTAILQGAALIPQITDNHREHIRKHLEEELSPEMEQHIAAHKRFIVLIARDQELQAFFQQQNANAVPGLQSGSLAPQGGAAPQQNQRIGSDQGELLTQ